MGAIGRWVGGWGDGNTYVVGLARALGGPDGLLVDVRDEEEGAVLGA